MLKEYLNGEKWRSVVNGVQMYNLPVDRLMKGIYKFPPCKDSGKVEIFFCCEGSISLGRREHPAMDVGEHEIIIVNQKTDIETVEISRPIMGYCVEIDKTAFRPLFENLCLSFNHMDLCDGRIGIMMSDHGGCMRIRGTSWSQALFSIMRSLSEEEQGKYCIMKIVELVYLLCAQHDLLSTMSDNLSVSGYLAGTIRNIRVYMENNLDEKIRISDLSRKFNISQTALKNGFRAIYGISVHAWLLDRRMGRASELLRLSDMTVLQISQAVGYEGVSQFNVVFKRKYGVTPRYFRKMSETVKK